MLEVKRISTGALTLSNPVSVMAARSTVPGIKLEQGEEDSYFPLSLLWLYIFQETGWALCKDPVSGEIRFGGAMRLDRVCRILACVPQRRVWPQARSPSPRALCPAAPDAWTETSPVALSSGFSACRPRSISPARIYIKTQRRGGELGQQRRIDARA